MEQDLSLTVEPSAFFDRQARIEWWDQSRLSQARILVVGAGALGNETIKNLSLLGVGYLLVIDLDLIEESNLSRAVLFRGADAQEGAPKAAVAARRARRLNPQPGAVIRAIQGDVVWELGAGVFRHVDLVLGCLDNIEARQVVNKRCWQAGKTWIDGAMWELSGSVAVYDASDDNACYECSMTPDHYRQAKLRYSCMNAVVKSHVQKGHEPTTQTTSAVVAAIQSQEAVKLLHGLPSFPGRRLVFNGAPHFYNDADFTPMAMTALTRNEACIGHAEPRYGDVLELTEATAALTTVDGLLTAVMTTWGWRSARLELGREFVISATCPSCGQRRLFRRPLFRLSDVELACPNCTVICPTCRYESTGYVDCPNCGQPDIFEPFLETIHTLSTEDEAYDQFAGLPLAELGIPSLDVLRVIGDDRGDVYAELTGDAATLWQPDVANHTPGNQEVIHHGDFA